MALADVTSSAAVKSAMAECQTTGRNAFLAKYGYRHARKYFLRYEDELYDSKAIVGVAHGIQHPDLGPLLHNQFSGGERTVAQVLRRLGFEVVVDVPGDLEPPLVLVENEATEGGHYDFWADATGERYHYPNKYRNMIKPGRRFVYYRGSRRKDGSRETAVVETPASIQGVHAAFSLDHRPNNVRVVLEHLPGNILQVLQH